MKDNWLKLAIKYFVVVLMVVLAIILLFLLSRVQIEQKLNEHKIWVEFFAASGTFVVALIALSPFLGKLLMPTRLTLGLDEKINIVISEDQNIRKVQAGLNFINGGKKDLLINRVIVEVIKKGDAVYVLDWNMFISDFFGKGAVPSKRPVPIKVDVTKSHYEMIQFFRDNPITIISDSYALRIRVWANQRSISDSARFSQIYNFTISEQDLRAIETEKSEILKGKEPRCRMISIPIDNWNFNNYEG